VVQPVLRFQPALRYHWWHARYFQVVLQQLPDRMQSFMSCTQSTRNALLHISVSMTSTYPTLARNAVPRPLAYPSLPLYMGGEQGFSAMMAIKPKSWNCHAGPGHDFRCAVSEVLPRIDQRKTVAALALYCFCTFICVF